jgi:polysaccharide biosynthesis/export protein
MRLIQKILVPRASKSAWSTGAVGLLFVFVVFPVMRSEVSAQVGTSVPNSPAHTERALQPHADKTSLIVTEDYIIGPEDVLEITVWRNSDLSKVVTVRPDGKVSLPLIGDVEAVGRSAGQLAELIATRLKEYKENPQVSIVVQQVNSYAIYVMGEITRPGKFPLKSKTTLLQAITLAGGFTPNAARNKLVVFRFGDKGQKDIKMKASYDDIILRDSSTQNFELKPGDTIVVPSETMVLVP